MNPLDRLLLDPEPLDPAMLGVADEDVLRERLGKYLQLSGFVADPDTPTLQPTLAQWQQTLALIYGARIVVLEGQADEFEAVGEVKLKMSVMTRITRLTDLRDAALAAVTAALTPPAPPVRRENPAPEFEEWGLR